MMSEESEREARAGATAAVPDAAGGAAAATEMTAAAAAAEAASVETVAGAAATPETLAAAATPATIQPTADPATGDARDTTTPPPSPPEEDARIRNSLETIKTAVVWLVVIQILTILSPLLRVSLKWSLIVGLILTLSSFAVAAVAYLKAQRAQHGLPE